jgi:putative membrane protein
MRKLWMAPIAALIVAFAPLAPTHAQTKTETSADTGFVQKALKSGEEEVALSKMAAEKAQNSDLKQFAQMLVSDHTAVNEQLRLLAQRNGATPAPRDGTKRGGTESSPPAATAPGAAPSSPQAAELAKLSGSEFDKKFLAIVVEGHEKSVELYSAEAETGKNPAVKKLAAETLPKIKEHLQQAKSLQQQVMEKKTQ